MSLQKALKKSKHLSLSAFSIALIALSNSPIVSAGINDTLENAFKFGQDDAKYGQVKLDLRYRFEQDDTKNPGKVHGDASTIRMRLGYLTPEFHGLQIFAEYEMNQDFGANTYNSSRNGKAEFEKIVDPQEHELNRFWISYKGMPNTEIKVGRQRIKLDNDRFIGNVGWRQLEQTFDAVLVTNQSFQNTTIKVGYINQRQTIHSFVQAMQTPFVNISYDFNHFGKLIGYGYFLDNNEKHAASNQTYGVSFKGGLEITDHIEGIYRLEYAYQKDHEQNPNSYDAHYYHVMGGANVHGITIKAGMEQLGGNGVGKVFQTPLATLHAFNGWSDQFLSTPADGLRDIYASVSGKLMGVKLMGVYHEFDDDTSTLSYGKEYDFLAVKKFANHYTLLAKYAYFDGDNGRFDAQNFWLEAGVSF
ncbi:MAG: alginate export family protein [Methylococcales bacterium]|nr:alginate export family protein [Methylococcales bacterium]